LLALLLVVDVREGAEPAHDPPGLVAERLPPAEEPAVRPGPVVPESEFLLERAARADRVLPAVPAGRQIVGVDARLPDRVRPTVLGKAGVFVPATVERIDRAVGPRRPDDLRDRFEEHTELRHRVVGRAGSSGPPRRPSAGAR